MEKIKPEVIGYKQIEHKGVRWEDDEFELMDAGDMKEESKFDIKCGFGKPKFRPVYKTD